VDISLVILGLLLLLATPVQSSARPQEEIAVGMGRIDDVVLSHGTGPISYVVLEPGTKDRLIPIPFGAFRVTTNGRLVLDIDQGRIYTAPSYPKGGRPNWSDRVWDQRVASFWGCMPRGVTKEQAEQQSSSSPSTGRRH